MAGAWGLTIRSRRTASPPLNSSVRFPSKRIGIMQRPSRLWQQVQTISSNALIEMDRASGPKPSQEMCALLILGEDRRIESHMGVDPVALIRSIWMTFVRGKRQGGSTIAMQLVRTITARYQRTVWRKITEILLAIRLTQSFSRFDIARIYLWLAYYGWNMHGFQQACEALSIVPSSASSIESAALVARLKYPHPRFRSKRQLVLIHRRARHLLALQSTNMGCGSVTRTIKHGTISNS